MNMRTHRMPAALMNQGLRRKRLSGMPFRHEKYSPWASFRGCSTPIKQKRRALNGEVVEAIEYALSIFNLDLLILYIKS